MCFVNGGHFHRGCFCSDFLYYVVTREDTSTDYQGCFCSDFFEYVVTRSVSLHSKHLCYVNVGHFHWLDYTRIVLIQIPVHSKHLCYVNVGHFHRLDYYTRIVLVQIPVTRSVPAMCDTRSVT